MTEAQCSLILIVAGMVATLGGVALWMTGSRIEPARMSVLLAFALAVSLVAVGRWQQTAAADVLSWWLMLMALPLLWPTATSPAKTVDHERPPEGTFPAVTALHQEASSDA
ncbi:hypothetical protein GC163_07050 [bacterium]|nr:hypothetical protein [bacterium]